MIVGPAIGGVLIGTAGAVAAFGVDAASFLASLACFVAMRSVPPRDDAEAPTWRSIVEGFRYARSRQELIGTYVVDFVAMVFGMPLALFPALAAGPLGGAALGPLYAAPAVGALVASLTSRWTPRVHRHGLAVMVAAAVWGVAIVGFGFSPSLWPALACLAIAGGADAISGIFRMTMWNQTIPDALRGRLAGIEMVSYMSGPLLGHVEAGAVAALAGVQASIVSGGRALRRRRRRLRPRPAPLPALRCPDARRRRAADRLRSRPSTEEACPMFRPVTVAALLALTVLAPRVGRRPDTRRRRGRRARAGRGVLRRPRQGRRRGAHRAVHRRRRSARLVRRMAARARSGRQGIAGLVAADAGQAHASPSTRCG